SRRPAAVCGERASIGGILSLRSTLPPCGCREPATPGEAAEDQLLLARWPEHSPVANSAARDWRNRSNAMPGPAMQTKRMLIVEDESATARRIGEIVAGHGYDVVSVDNSPAFLEHFQRLSPDLVL